jgi:8-oxo-dGTP pyrophosphatase MutT (NUDIX family)
MNLQVGTKALIVNDEGQYLFIHRARGLADGSGTRWDIPGGRIKSHEAVLVALKREVQEEVGLLLSPACRLIRAQDIFVEANNARIVRLTYLVQASGSVNISSEHQGFRWLHTSEALELGIDPYLRQVLVDDLSH